MPADAPAVATQPANAAGTAPAQAAGVSKVLVSLKADLVKISKDYPELTGVADVQVIQDMGLCNWYLSFFHNCVDGGKPGYEDTGPNPAAICFRVTTPAESRWELTHLQTRGFRGHPSLRYFVVDDSIYTGKNPTPGFVTAIDALLAKHVAMIEQLDRTMAAPLPAAPTQPVNP